MNKDSLFIAGITRAIKVVNYLSANKLLVDAWKLGILFIAVTALAFSPIFTKLGETQLSPTSIIFNRLWIATVIIGCWQLFIPPTSIKPTQSTIGDDRQSGWLVAASLCATVSAVLWAISFNHTSVASSTVLRSLTPLFISLGAWLIFKQHFKRQFLIGMVLSIIGAIVIGWDDLQLGKELLLGDSIALLSAALHGANILIIGYLRDRGCTTNKVLLWRCGCGALIIFPLVSLTDSQLLPNSLFGWLNVIALAIVCQTFGQGLLVYSLKQFSASFVGVFTLLKPAIATLLAWVIFTEEVSITNGAALLLILVGIYLAKSSDSDLPSAAPSQQLAPSTEEMARMPSQVSNS